MPVTLTDDPSVFPDIQAPIGADGRDAASVAVPFQRIANRTRQNKNRIDVIAPSTDGVRVLRTVASIVALQAIGASNHTDGSYAIVEDIGLYRYDVDSLTTALSPVVVQPTDVVGGGTPGRWHLVAFGKGSLGIANGIAQCDATGRVPAASVRNGIIYDAATINALNTVGADIGTPQSFPGLLVGDRIKFHYYIKVQPTAGHQATAQVNVGDPGSGVNVVAGSATIVVTPASGTPPLADVLLSGGGFFDVVAPGTHTLVIRGGTDGTAANFQNAQLLTQVIRP